MPTSRSSFSRRSADRGRRVHYPALAALAQALLQNGFGGDTTAMVKARRWSRRTVTRLLEGRRKPRPNTQRYLVELWPRTRGESETTVADDDVATRYNELLKGQESAAAEQPREFLTEEQLFERTKALGSGSAVVVVGAALYRTPRKGQRARHAERLAKTVTDGQTVVFLHAHQARLRPEEGSGPESGYLERLEEGLKKELEGVDARGYHAAFDSGDALIGPVTSPFVLTLRPCGEGEMSAESLYQKVPTPDSGYMWVKLDDERMEWFCPQLRRSVVPVRNPRFLSLSSTIHRRYSGYDQSAYDAIACLKGDEYRQTPLLPPEVVKGLTERCDHRIRVLEVGGRNLRESFDLFYKPLVVGEQLPIQALVLEPQFERLPVDSNASQRLQDIRGVYSKATLEEFHPREGARFDLVLVNHRLYLSNPSVLGKLVMLLQPGGFLVVLHSPRADNVFSTISELTQDALLPPADSSTVRSYSEDLQAWFRRHMKEVAPQRVERQIPLDRMLQGEDLTADLEEAVRHLTLDANLTEEDRRSMLLKVRRYLMSYSDRGSVDATEHLFVVERPLTMEWADLLP